MEQKQQDPPPTPRAAGDAQTGPQTLQEPRAEPRAEPTGVVSQRLALALASEHMKGPQR